MTLFFSDGSRLPASSYTHLNNGFLTRSWLDHCLCNQTVHSAITDLFILDEYFGSDHFPLVIVVDFEVLPNTSIDLQNEIKIKRGFCDSNKVDAFYSNVHRYMVHELDDMNMCHTPYCESSVHKQTLEDVWSRFAQIIKICGRQVFGSSRIKQKIIPGWNTYLKHLYDDSKAALINWRRAGSPRGGMVADDMRRRRARFKCELKRCKANEDILRSESLATKLASRNLVSFWKDVQSFTSNGRRLPQTVEGVSGELEIENFWRDKYSHILNNVYHRTEGTVFEASHSVPRDRIEFTTMEEICLCASELSNRHSPGMVAPGFI